MMFVHGTTRILQLGPDPRYQEPGGSAWNDGFSMYVEAGPFLFDSPEVYARRKAGHFPNEGGPVILRVDIPDEVLESVDSDLYPLSQGLVQFDEGAGLEELLAAWASLTKEIRAIS